MKTSMWISGFLFGLGLVALAMWAANTDCVYYFESTKNVACVGKVEF